MKVMCWLSIVLLTSACTTTPIFAPPPDVTTLFHDDLFKPASIHIDPDDALAITPAMEEYAQTKLRFSPGRVDTEDRRVALVSAMYKKGELKLDYDATQTLTAAQAFESKRGNCLSLVLLTAVMAKQVGLPMHFQSVIGTTDWQKSDYFFMSVGHVNLALESIPNQFELHTFSPYSVVVDFLPPDKAYVLDTIEISEQTVLAMFANNRAVETMIQGNVDDAYWWARAAILEDQKYVNAYLTLGVIYRSLHRSDYAESVLEAIAKYEPNNTTMLTNQILVLRDLDRNAEANALVIKLANLDSNPPWDYYLRAQNEYAAGHYEVARHLYEKEIARDPEHHEIEYGLAQCYAKLNDIPRAIRHLKRAIELSQSGRNRAFYQSRLEMLTTAGGM